MNRIRTQTGTWANTLTETEVSNQARRVRKARTDKTLAQTQTKTETQIETKRTVGDALSDPRGILHKHKTGDCA